MVPTKKMHQKEVWSQTAYFIIMLIESPVNTTLPVPAGYHHKQKPHSTAEMKHWDFPEVFPLIASFITFLHLPHAPKTIF